METFFGNGVLAQKDSLNGAAVRGETRIKERLLIPWSLVYLRITGDGIFEATVSFCFDLAATGGGGGRLMNLVGDMDAG